MKDVPKIQSGDMPYAEDYSNLIDNVEELAAKSSQDASLGFPPEIEIYELTADPALNEDWNVYTAKAKRVRTQYASSTAGDYVIEDTYPEEDVYFPCPLDNTAPGQSSGDRVSTILIDGKRVMIGGGGGGTSLFQLARLISSLTCGGMASAQPQEYVDGVGYMDDLSKVPIDVYDTTLSSGGFADGSVVQYQTSDGKNWVVDMPCLSQME